MDIIYIVCVKLEKIDGSFHYDPYVNPEDIKDIKLLACDNLLSLQNDNKEVIDMLSSICDVIIVPVTLDVYKSLEKELSNLLDNVEKAVDEAVEKIGIAYKTMGIKDFDIDEAKELMLSQALSCGNIGKVIDENCQMVDMADNYVVRDEDDEDDSDYTDDDYSEDDYDDDEYDDEINEDE